MRVNVRAGMQMMIKRLVISTGVVFGIIGAPSTLAAGGTPAYQVESVAFQWIDATAGIKQQAGIAIPIGFDFQFYGETFNSLAILETGVIVLGPDASLPGFFARPLLSE